jgi:hypothetical protein
MEVDGILLDGIEVEGIEVWGIEVWGMDIDGMDGEAAAAGGAAMALTPTPAPAEIWAMAGAAIRPAMAQAAKSIVFIGSSPGKPPPQAAQHLVDALVPS